jgi:hypothetical protein
MKRFTVALLAVSTIAGASMSQLPGQAYPGPFAVNHPRRAEVLGRDRGIRGEVRADRGLLGGHYGQLMHEDRSIRGQEQRDARINGGFITRGQRAQLNREENREQRQINRDFRW